MSHIPSAAMPHAKPHEPAPPPAPIAPSRPATLPWAALAAGGVLAIGGAVTAALLLRGRGGRKRGRGRRGPAKGHAGKPRKPRTADRSAD